MTKADSGVPFSGEPANPSEALDARYRAPLMAYFLRRVGDRAEAEDLTQEVFLRMVRREDATVMDSVDAFIFTVAANLLRDRDRRAETHRREAHVSLDGGSVTGEMSTAAALVEDRTPSRVLIGQEALSDVLRALDELNERTRDVFILFRLENMKQREIAQLFGLSVSAVEKHVTKALAHLALRTPSA